MEKRSRPARRASDSGGEAVTPKFKPGDRVLFEGTERVVARFDADSCGEGCCDMYTLEGEPDVGYFEWQLKPIREAAIEAREARIIALQSRIDTLEGFKQGALEGAEYSRQRIAALEAENCMLQSKIMQSDETIRVLEVALNTIANVVQHPDVVAEEALERLAESRGEK